MEKNSKSQQVHLLKISQETGSRIKTKLTSSHNKRPNSVRPLLQIISSLTGKCAALRGRRHQYPNVRVKSTDIPTLSTLKPQAAPSHNTLFSLGVNSRGLHFCLACKLPRISFSTFTNDAWIKQQRVLKDFYPFIFCGGSAFEKM